LCFSNRENAVQAALGGIPPTEEKGTTMHLFALPDRAFTPLPSEANLLTGTPKDYRYNPSALQCFGGIETQEAAGCLMVALIMHGRWEAIRVSVILEAMRQRAAQNAYEAHQLPNDTVPESFLIIRRGIDGLIGQGFFGANEDANDLVIWPTTEFAACFAGNKVGQPVN
jgi:hypothetical protein